MGRTLPLEAHEAATNALYLWKSKVENKDLDTKVKLRSEGALSSRVATTTCDYDVHYTVRKTEEPQQVPRELGHLHIFPSLEGSVAQ